jgi:hypothetical protein
MWTASVGFDSLLERNRWNVEFFCDPTSADGGISAFPMCPVRELAKERRGSMDPQEAGDTLLNYLGLENIQSLTGELVSFEPRPGKSVKSRSKKFFRDDVLYGRLRPNLNKVYHATDPVAEGICSGEFFVLIPDTDVIRPIVLRYLLASEHVQRHAARFQIGTALPRMNLDDLMDIQLPVPPLEIQRQYEQELASRYARLVSLRAELDSLPGAIAGSLLAALEQGDAELKL